jgi:glycosyltransferase involved in cell wall biosynthesis
MLQNQNIKPSISLFFPVYNDEMTIERLTLKCMKVLEEVTEKFEIIIVNDGSPDNSGAVADAMAEKYPCVKVVHHEVNKGYGAAIQTGFKNATYEWVCFTDGDDEYDVYDLFKLIKLKDYYDLIITFRYVKLYSNFRIFISGVYNKLFRLVFRTNYRDISTGLRLIRKSVYDDLVLISDSPFIGAEITLRTMLKGYRVGEVGIQTFPREFGSGASTSFKNIMRTLSDMRKVYNNIFSPYYDLPDNRKRKTEDVK